MSVNKISERIILLPAILGFFLFMGQHHSTVHAASTAITPEHAREFIQNMGDEVISYIVDNNMDENKRSKKLEAVLKGHFDTYTISRFVLGRYWRSLTAKEQTEYQSLFEDMIVAIYSRNFSS